jgi:D-xylulose reductase
LEEGALVEPLAIGVHAAEVAHIKPGDVALVLGSGTIGLVTALAALAGGCSTVVVTDIVSEKLQTARNYSNIITVNTSTEDVSLVVDELTDSHGVDIIFDASGSANAIEEAVGYLKVAGTLVLIGMPTQPIPLDIVKLQIKEVTIKTIFRYANNFEQALRLISSGAVDIKHLISRRFSFDQSVEAFELATEQNADIVKVLIALE